MPLPVVLAAVVSGLALLAPEAGAADWPEFRGPHRTGLGSGAMPTRFGPGTNQLWAREVPAGHASPVVVGDQVLLTGATREQLVVLALDRRDGTERWRRELPPGTAEPGSRLSHPATATAVSDGEQVIAYFAPFGLAAFGLDGTPRWTHRLPTPVTQHGASSSPVIAGDLVIQLCDQDVGSYLLALDRRTGQVRWRVERPTARRGFSTPLPWPPAQPDHVVVAGTLQLTAYRLSDGSASWNVRGLPNELVASPVPAGDDVLVAGWTPGAGVARMPEWGVLVPADQDGDAQLTRDEAPNGPAKQHFTYIDADKDGRLTREEYETIASIFNESRNAVMRVRPGGTGDVTESRVVWRQTRGLPYVPTPLVYEGRVYLVKNGGLATCLSLADGAYLFQEERLGAMGDYYASPIAADGKVLAFSQPGTGVVFRAGDTLEVLERNALGEEVLATPALVDGVLYVRTRTRLFAFTELEKATAP